MLNLTMYALSKHVILFNQLLFNKIFNHEPFGLLFYICANVFFKSEKMENNNFSSMSKNSADEKLVTKDFLHLQELCITD